MQTHQYYFPRTLPMLLFLGMAIETLPESIFLHSVQPQPSPIPRTITPTTQPQVPLRDPLVVMGFVPLPPQHDPQDAT